MISDEQKETLIAAARAVRCHSYSPYSKYPVGVALFCEDGSIITGANVENASYGLTCCAERAAVFAAVSQGKQQFTALALATRDGGSPCGACRQVLNEFNPKMLVIVVADDGACLESSLEDLLPHAFGPYSVVEG